MVNRKTDIDMLLGHARRRFCIYGYAGMSMADLAGDCGLLKGSLYHYFPSKLALALAVLDQDIELFRNKVFTLALESENDDASVPLDRFCSGLSTLLKAEEPGESNEQTLVRNGAVIAHFAWDSAAEAELRDRLDIFFNEWISVLAGILTPLMGAHRSVELAADALARLLGGLAAVRINQGAEAMLRRLVSELRSAVN